MTRRSLPLLGATLALMAGAGPCAWASERAAFTQMEAGPYGRADRVVEATIDRVMDVAPHQDVRRGPQLVYAHVVQVFKGPRVLEAGAPITIRVAGPRPTLTPERPSAPYLKPGAKGRHVFFLRQRQGGHAFDLDAMFEAESKEGRQKVQVLAMIARLQRERNEAQRGRATRDWLIRRLTANSRWARIHAARELNYLVETCPHLFGADVHQRLQALPRTRMPREQQVWLQRLLSRLSAVSPSTPVRSVPRRGPTAEPENAWRKAYREAPDESARTQLLDRALDVAGQQGGVDAYTDVLWALDRARREGAKIDLIVRFARGGHRRLAPALRVRYATTESQKVREALVRAVGFLGSDGDVPWLHARLRNVSLARTALLALARIRTSRAKEILRGEYERHASGGEDARAHARWIEHLLSDEFVAESD